MLKQIGKYTISERIGRGTYSRVYRAIDLQGRPVAIKLSTTQIEPTQLEYFQKDLVTAASVLHPNLVSVHDLAFEDDFPYLVMELVDGQDLGRLLKSNIAPTLAERMRIMQQAAEALRAAHERGVFHLDLRPSKIMVNQDGAAKVLDLGLGRLSYDPERATENGYLVGAPFYMSPERLAAIDTANEQCDIWSYGVTFYEWVSGRHPFYDDDGDQMIGNIMDGTAPELSDVHPGLNRLIHRALAKDPVDRYRSFGPLLDDLTPLVADLKREESEAMMAEALRQTDSGRWHEARRIARQMRDMEPGEAETSQVFGVSEFEPDVPEPAEPQIAATTANAAAAVGAGIAVASVATAVEIPEPEPMMQPAAEYRPVVEAPAAAPRPERIPPKIPSIGGRNGAAENGAPARTQASGGNGSAGTATRNRTARTETPTPQKSESKGSDSGGGSASSVRILQETSSGFPWAKILGFTVPALLVAAALLFFLRPLPNKPVRNPAATEEAKQISRSTTAPAPGESGTGNAQPPANSATTPIDGQPIDGTPSADGQNPDAPKVFDPKTLAGATKLVTPPRRRGKGPLAGVNAPAIGDGASATGTDLAALPIGVNAPPPPAPVAPVASVETHATPATNASVPAASGAPTVEAVHETAMRTGGRFSHPVLVHRISPAYPPAAVQRRVQGIVRFQATIAKDGSVKDIQLVSGDPSLNMAARQAVTQFKYRPATLNGEPIEVTQEILINFKLSDR